MSTKIGAELFDLVQSSQGFAFISDSISDWSKTRVLNIARSSLIHTENTARILRAFIAKHDSKPN